MSFGDRVETLSTQYKTRLKRVRDKTVLGVVNQAQTTRASGGRMPVDTGYLRRSIRGALKIPSESSGTPLSALLMAPLGTPVYIGWHASYAGIQELKNGFMRGALGDVQRHVNAAASQVQ